MFEEMTIEITQKCPNICLHCSSYSSPNATYGDLDKQKIFSIVDEAKKHKIKSISISGGEPLLHKNVVDITQYIVDQNIEVALYTTGIYTIDNVDFSFENWDMFDPKVKIIFSIHSMDEHIHDLFVGKKGSFKLAIQSIHNALQEKRNIEIHMVPNKMTLHTIDESLKKLYSIGVKKVSLLRMVPQCRAAENLPLLQMSEEDIFVFKNIVENAQANIDTYPSLRCGIPFSGIVQKKLQCFAGVNKFVVRYDGIILPCEAFKGAANLFIIGILGETTIDAILRNGRKHKLLKNLKKAIQKNNI